MHSARLIEKRANLLYPLMLIAAVTVIVFSLVGIATMLGWLPSAQSKSDSASRSEAVVGSEPAPAASGGGPAGVVRGERGAAPVCGNCGVIESIRVVEAKGEGSGLGAVTGGVVGGVLGNQVGRGTGRAVMTVVGAGAGAYAGNEIEKNVKRSTQYQIRVRMDNGSYRTIYQQSQPALGPGQRVRVSEDGLAAAG
ncbi:MAG: glycine zipper 2TM domain-containing protein [Burkholderiales bacterium]